MTDALYKKHQALLGALTRLVGDDFAIAHPPPKCYLGDKMNYRLTISDLKKAMDEAMENNPNKDAIEEILGNRK